MQTPIPRPEVQDSDFGAFQEATAKLDSAWPLPNHTPPVLHNGFSSYAGGVIPPSIRDQRVIHWLGMPWFVTYKGPYIHEVNINGHWLNAAYVLGAELVRDLEMVARREAA